MSYTSDQVAILAGNIYSGLGAPTSQSVGYVSGWLTDGSSLGDLNNRLNTSFSITGGGIAGDFGDEEASIYSMMYKAEYYEGQARNVLAAGGLNWVSLSEGDSKVTRANPVDMSKAFLGLHNEIQSSLYIAVANWKRGQSLVANVDSSSLYSWP